jgi:histidinol dehydrogenase
MKIVKAPSRAADAAIARLERNRSRSERSADVVARRVIAQIRNDGDAAASRLVAQFDGVEIKPHELLIATGEVRSDTRALTAAIDLAIERIERFHRGQLPAGYSIDGLTHRVRPLRRVGIYVPGGSAVYLELLETCKRLGVSEIYRAGGPAGIAAMALGTATLRRVDKIVGPGNAYVTAAKKQLIGNVGIDMVAGPTELVLIADDDANETLAAADLLAQAEHGRDSAVICITFSRSAAVRIGDEVGRQLMEGNRAAEECIVRNSVIFQVTSGEEAVALANRIAPEHLSLHWAEARQWLDRLDNCGAIFVGSASPVAAGDYIAGPNHVLPTGGTARFTSPLGVYDFVKRSNIIELSDAESAAIAGAGAAIARFEGLPRHARSLELREGERP